MNNEKATYDPEVLVYPVEVVPVDRELLEHE